MLILFENTFPTEEQQKRAYMWTKEIEELLQTWTDQARRNSILYNYAAIMYTKRDRWLRIPVIVLGTVTTSTMFIQMDNCDPIQHLITGLFSLSATLLASLGSVLEFRELAVEYKKTANEYDNLAMDIREQFSLTHDQREDAKDFVKTCKSTLKRLKNASNVPASVLQQYSQELHNRPLVAPAIIKPSPMPSPSPSEVQHPLHSPLRILIPDSEEIDNVCVQLNQKNKHP